MQLAQQHRLQQPLNPLRLEQLLPGEQATTLDVVPALRVRRLCSG